MIGENAADLHWEDRIARLEQEVTDLRRQLAEANAKLYLVEACHVCGKIHGSHVKGNPLSEPLQESSEWNRETLQERLQRECKEKPGAMARIMGKWPGNETDEQIEAALKAIS